MKISELDRIKLLIDALKGFQSGLLTNATWAIGITAVAGGWLMTSNEALAYFGDHRNVSRFFTLLIIVSTIGYAYLTLKVQQVSQSVYVQLRGLESAKGLFEHHRVSLEFAWAYVIFQILASLALVTVLVSAQPSTTA